MSNSSIFSIGQPSKTKHHQQSQDRHRENKANCETKSSPTSVSDQYLSDCIIWKSDPFPTLLVSTQRLESKTQTPRPNLWAAQGQADVRLLFIISKGQAHEAALTLFEMAMSVKDTEKYASYESEPMLLICIFVFLIVVIIFLSTHFQSQFFRIMACVRASLFLFLFLK